MENQRLTQIDALRGFALFGILIVNIWYFADSHFGADTSNPLYQTALDMLIRCFNALVFEAKFYLLFSFLFGYSFYLQFLAAERAGAMFQRRIWRRLIALLLLGLVHGVLLYDAEILCLYACCGLVLFGLRNKSDAFLLKCSLALLIMAALFWFSLGYFIDIKLELKGDVVRLAAFRGDVLQTLTFHWQSFPEMFGNLLILQSPSVIAMFLLGYCGARTNSLSSALNQAQALRQLFWPWLPLLLPLALMNALVYAYCTQFLTSSKTEMWAYGLQQLTAPILSAAYVYVLLNYLIERPQSWLALRLQAAGKFALSNYLLQSLLLSLIFTGYGLRLIDRLAPWQIYLLAGLIYCGQLQLSWYWRHYFHYGPAEYLLRAFTLWQFPVLRRNLERPGTN